MSTPAPKVLVVGAGPSGLISALTLLQNGVPVRIIAKEEAHRVGQRGSGISPRTLEVYNFLGVHEVSETAVYNADVFEHAKGSAEVQNIVRMCPWVEPSPSCPWRTMRLIGQNSAEEILRSHLARFGCEVELGTALSTFQQDSEHVTAVLVKTVDGKVTTESIEVDWLIGGDGARGVTRKSLGLTFLGESRENQNLVTGDVPVKGLSWEGWHNYGNRASKGLSLKPSEKPNSDERQFFIMGPDVDHEKLCSDRAALLDFFVELTGLAREAFGEVVWVTNYKPNWRVVNKFGEGRVFVVGDAAHVHSPMGGQGMNSSVQDAFNLAWKLALVAKGHAQPSLLDTYTTERLPVIAEMLNITKLLQKITADPSATNAWERDGKLMQLGINYRGSPIIVDETKDGAGGAKGDSYNVGGTLRGGDRAPNAPALLDLRRQDGANGAATIGFFDLFKPYKHTVLVFSSGAPTEQCAAILRALERYPEGLVQSAVVHSWQVYRADEAGLELATMALKDKLGHAYDGYAVVPRAELPTVYIVRPDGVIGALVHGVEGVDKYFGGIFL